MSVRILGCVALALITAIPYCRAQTYEVEPLPKITIGTIVNVDGKVVENKNDTYLGVLGLPLRSHPQLREVVPPIGFQETTTKESILIQGKKIDVKRIDWTTRPGVYTNVRAGKVTLWVSDLIKTPEFGIPLIKGSAVPLLAGTVKFETQPSLNKDLPGVATAKGTLLDVKAVSIGTRKIQAYRFQMEMKSADVGFKGEMWVSWDVPGKLFKMEGDVTAGKMAGKLLEEIKQIEDEMIPEGMTLVEKSGFAIGVPKGWQIATPKMKTKDEVLRFVPANADAKLDRAITIEVRAASGKDFWKWGRELVNENQEFGLSFHIRKGIGDEPAFTVSRRKGSAVRVATLKVGTVRADQVFIISHWQNGIPERTGAGEEEIQQVADSWRWLRRKATP